MGHIDFRRTLNVFGRGLLRTAKKINIAVTNKCNLRCKTCYVWKMYQDHPELASKELTIYDYENFFERLNFWSWISFTGGEPFLRNDLADLALVAIEKCRGLHTVSIPTNGFLTDTIVEQVEKILRESNIPSLYVNVSLDGLQELHDFSRGVNGSFEHALNTYKSLKEIDDHRLKMHFEYAISKLNQGKLAEVVKVLNLDPSDFVLTIAQNSFFYGNEATDVKPKAELLKKDIKWFLRHLKPHTIHDLAQSIFLKHVIEGKTILCIAGRNSFYMDAYGRIFPCLLVERQIGSVKKGIGVPFAKESECRCYTPCESYFALLLDWPREFVRFHLGNRWKRIA